MGRREHVPRAPAAKTAPAATANHADRADRVASPETAEHLPYASLHDFQQTKRDGRRPCLRSRPRFETTSFSLGASIRRAHAQF